MTLREGDTLRVINPFLYSTPGMTDESNALVEIRLHDADICLLDQSGAEETELFDGFVLLTREEAKEVLHRGRDAKGDFYSIFTWAALMHFLSPEENDNKL